MLCIAIHITICIVNVYMHIYVLLYIILCIIKCEILDLYNVLILCLYNLTFFYIQWQRELLQVIANTYIIYVHIIYYTHYVINMY